MNNKNLIVSIATAFFVMALAVGSFAVPAHADGFADFGSVFGSGSFPLPPLPPLPSFPGGSGSTCYTCSHPSYRPPTTTPTPAPTPVPTQTQTNNNNQNQTTYVNVTNYPSQPTYSTPVYSTPIVYNTPVIYNTPSYNYPTYSSSYYSPYPSYYVAPLSVSCGTNAGTVPVGAPVTWTAYATGGYGAYSYSWNGTDGLYGTGQTFTYAYNLPGSKYATVTVYSGGQTFTANCSPIANVIGPIYAPAPQPIPVSYNNGLDVGCYADPKAVAIGQPTTWNVEVTGGFGPYSYNWTGSEGLAGNQNSVIKFYGTPGTKSAIVTVVSADGRSSTRACSNAVTVKSNYVAPKLAPKPVPPPQYAPIPAQPQPNYGQSASALLSLQNVPWGWVAILIILVLFATVLYLLFNRQKI